MLSHEQLYFIEYVLKSENSDEFVRELVLRHSNQSLENMQSMLALIPSIANSQIEHKQQRINRYCRAYETLIGQRCIENMDKRKKGKKLPLLPFPVMLAGGVAHFPNVLCANGSPAEVSFLTELVECIQAKQGFDYENPEDWNYITHIAECEDWLLKFIHTYIDSEFVRPSSDHSK